MQDNGCVVIAGSQRASTDGDDASAPAAGARGAGAPTWFLITAALTCIAALMMPCHGDPDASPWVPQCLHFTTATRYFIVAVLGERFRHRARTSLAASPVGAVRDSSCSVLALPYTNTIFFTALDVRVLLFDFYAAALYRLP